MAPTHVLAGRRSFIGFSVIILCLGFMSFSAGTRFIYDWQTLLDLRTAVAMNYEDRSFKGDG